MTSYASFTLITTLMLCFGFSPSSPSCQGLADSVDRVILYFIDGLIHDTIHASLPLDQLVLGKYNLC